MNRAPASRFGEMLRHYRIAAGLTQEALAEDARISSRAISDLDRGLRDRPRPETIQRLANALGLAPDERSAFGSVVRRSRRSAEQASAPPDPKGTAADDGFPHHNLPTYLTSFIGRKREVTDVRRLLQTSRLVTLSGTGGSGKTRLTVHVARELTGSFPEGVWLIDLAPLTDPTLLPQRVGTTLGVGEQPDRSIEAILTMHLQSQRTLLVLDNCEHVADASARLVEVLLSVCPTIQILATSRSPLGIPGEVRYGVPPLPCPPAPTPISADDPRRYAAVELFVERAQAVRPTFAPTEQTSRVVVEICQRIDGLPLAIELAAAWVRVLTIEQIAARLDDRFRLLTRTARIASRRHQSLRAAIDESYGLLSELERTLLRRLAVFAGGWTLEAAEAVGEVSGIGCQELGDTQEPSVLDLLAGLVDQSLVVVEEHGDQARYRLLEIIRQYAHEKLREMGEEGETRDRHLDWYLALAERAWPELTRRDQVRWFGRINAEYDNLRAALDWSRTNKATAEKELQLAGALGRYWHMRHYYDEGSERLQHALARADRRPSRALSLALNWAGRIAATKGDYLRAKPLVEEAVAVSRSIGDSSLLSLALRHLAVIEQALGLQALADDHLEAALVVAQSGGDGRETAWNLTVLGDRAVQKGDLRLGRQHLDLALQLARESGDRSGIAAALGCMSRLETEEGNLERARSLTEAAKTMSAELELGNACVDIMGDAVQAMLAIQTGHLPTASAHVQNALHFAKEFGEHEAMVAGLLAYATLQTESGDPTSAARMYAFASSQGAASRVIDRVLGRVSYEDWLAATRAALGPRAFDAAWADGQTMTREQAVDEALRSRTTSPSSFRRRDGTGGTPSDGREREFPGSLL